MKIKKLTSEEGEVKYEVYSEIGGMEMYSISFTPEEAKGLKALLNARNDI